MTEPLANADLGVTIALLAVFSAVFSKLLPAIKEWLVRGSKRQITIKVGDKTFELQGLPTEDLKRVVESLKSNGGEKAQAEEMPPKTIPRPPTKPGSDVPGASGK